MTIGRLSIFVAFALAFSTLAVGNPITYMHKGKQYVAVLTGVGGWAAIGLAEGLTKGSEGLGAVGLTASLSDFSNLGGTLVVFSVD